MSFTGSRIIFESTILKLITPYQAIDYDWLSNLLIDCFWAVNAPEKVRDLRILDREIFYGLAGHTVESGEEIQIAISRHDEFNLEPAPKTLPEAFEVLGSDKIAQLTTHFFVRENLRELQLEYGISALVECTENIRGHEITYQKWENDQLKILDEERVLLKRQVPMLLDFFQKITKNYTLSSLLPSGNQIPLDLDELNEALSIADAASINQASYHWATDEKGDLEMERVLKQDLSLIHI